MISGADDRLAFVIETEAELSGVIAARSQVKGLGDDVEQSAVKMAAASRSQASGNVQVTDSTRAMTLTQMKAIEMNNALAASVAGASATTVAATIGLVVLAAMQVLAKNQAGQHSFAMGRLERNLGNVAGEAVGLNKSVELLSTGLLKFSVGTIETIGILAGIAAITWGFHKMTDEANEGAKKLEEAQLQNLKNVGIGNVVANLAGIRTARNQAIEEAAKAADAGYFTRLKNMLGADLSTVKGRAVAAGGGVDFTDLDRLNKLNEKGSEIALNKLHVERLRLLAQHDQMEFTIKTNALELIGAKVTEGSLDQNFRRREQLITQAAIEDARIKQSFVYRDEQGHILALTAEQTRELNKLLVQHRALIDIQDHELTQADALASAAYKRAVNTAVAGAGGDFSDSTVADRYQAKVDEINALADLERKHGEDAVEVERKRQAAIRALRKETLRQASDDAKSITDVLLASGSRDVRAVGHAADAIRRVLIGAQAAHAAVESAIEGGKAIGALATGNFSGAALHAASALELAKAAALGAQESLGGGRGTSGSSGASSSGGSTTFEPRIGTEGQGSLTLNLYSMNPYGAEQIQQLQFSLNRAEILKVPVPISPTNQIRAVA